MWRDFIPRFDRAGAKREKDSIITLASDSKASAFDHEFMSHTYQENQAAKKSKANTQEVQSIVRQHYQWLRKFGHQRRNHILVMVSLL